MIEEKTNGAIMLYWLFFIYCMRVYVFVWLEAWFYIHSYLYEIDNKFVFSESLSILFFFASLLFEHKI